MKSKISGFSGHPASIMIVTLSEVEGRHPVPIIPSLIFIFPFSRMKEN
jgi:hypothetical protein